MTTARNLASPTALSCGRAVHAHQSQGGPSGVMSSKTKMKVATGSKGGKAVAALNGASKAAKPVTKPGKVSAAAGTKKAAAAAVKKPVAKAAATSKAIAKPAIKASPSTKPSPKTASKPVAAKSSAGIKLPAAKAMAAGPPARPQIRAAEQKPEKKLTTRARSTPIVLTPDYRPSETEPFMSEMHRAYFRQKLTTWKDEIIRQTKETLVILHEDSVQHADIADRATSETDRSLELRARDRQRKLIAKIDSALARIDDGSYGYCEDTGEPIGLKRLEARPIATLSLEAQERHERREKVYRED